MPPPLPYEAISLQIQSIAHRTSLDSLIFPVDTLLTLVCEYYITHASETVDPSWPVQLFLQLGVPHAVLVRTLENILDAQEAPFTGRRRLYVVEWLNVALEGWLQETERRGAGKGGDSGLAPWVAELMERAEQADVEIVSPRDGRVEGNEVWRKARTLRAAVGNALRTSMQGTMRFGR